MLDCVICLRETLTLTTLTCSHSFCEDCVGCWLAISNKCPLCTQVVSNTSPSYKHEEQEHAPAPSMDFSYDLAFIQRKLAALFKQVNNKLQTSQNVKSNVSKVDAQYYFTEYKETQELIHIFELLVAENNTSSETTHLLETINFKLMDLQNMLDGKVQRSCRQEEKWVNEEDYEQDFPEIGGYHVEKFQKKFSTKGSKTKEKREKNTVK